MNEIIERLQRERSTAASDASVDLDEFRMCANLDTEAHVRCSRTRALEDSPLTLF